MSAFAPQEPPSSGHSWHCLAHCVGNQEAYAQRHFHSGPIIEENRPVGIEQSVLKAEYVADLVERQPDDLARTVATVAMGRLGEGVGQFPFLRFVAPLGGRVRDDVIGTAVRADRRTPRRPRRPPVDILGLFLLRIKRIEK